MMNVQIDQLVKSLLKKDSLEQCSLQELRQYAERHPYFGAAQLLLTKKLQTEDPVLYEEQLQKTYLFFHNPLWVEHLLNENGTASITNGKAAAPEVKVAAPDAGPEKEPVEAILPAEANPGTDVEKDQPGPGPDLETSQVELPEIKMPAVESVLPATSGTDMLFQPYHTVDYFASQGIKIRDEEKPADKFGKQLKSFTDWLKTMKRLPVSEVTKNIDRGSEHKVEQLAEHSIEDREVVTEAMAEVWEKQKNYDRAIAVYRKLSLLDPPKSAYFAAKIEDLKKYN